MSALKALKRHAAFCHTRYTGAFTSAFGVTRCTKCGGLVHDSERAA